MRINSVISIIASASVAYGITLREAANGFTFGVAGASQRFDDETYMGLVNSEFNTMVAENGCKFNFIQPERGVYNFTDCDAHYNKAIALGQKFRGHCLVWHSDQPEWFQNITDSTDMENTIVDHITTVLNHYRGKIDTWDIVNEAIDNDATGEDGTWQYTDSFIYRALPNFVDVAFKTAREVDPTVKLFYNDYNIEGVDVRECRKTNAVYNFVKDLVDRGVPIDGVGIQYHLRTNRIIHYENVLETMKRFGELGLEVQITEMDVSIQGMDVNDESLALQAKFYADGLQACLDSPYCTGFLIWGVGDSDSWRAETFPLIFDGDYKPKPAYYALLDVFSQYEIVEEQVTVTEDCDTDSEDEEVDVDGTVDVEDEDSYSEEDEDEN